MILSKYFVGGGLWRLLNINLFITSARPKRHFCRLPIERQSDILSFLTDLDKRMSYAKTQFVIDKVNTYFNREVVKLYLKFMISKFKWRHHEIWRHYSPGIAQDDRRRRIGFWLIQIAMKKSILMKLYQITEDCGLLLYIGGRLIYQSRDFKKRQGRSTSLLIHPFYSIIIF